MAVKNALITGVNGQDGTYLAELLIQKGYRVYGLGLQEKPSRFLPKRAEYRRGDVLDLKNTERLMEEADPDEIYNFAGLSSVGASFENPEKVYELNGMAVLRLLKAVRARQEKIKKQIKFYQASSSEMFGNAPAPQDENTPFRPLSPYACAKILAHYTAGYFRKAYGMFVCCGILFNHESPRRPENFVTRKITKGVADIKKGLSSGFMLGDLSVRRDWGYAPEYVEAAWRMMQGKVPDDYVVGTGESHSLEDFVRLAFEHAELGDWKKYVRQDESLLRPAEIKETAADPQKAKRVLGWEAKTGFRDLVGLMVDYDLEN